MVEVLKSRFTGPGQEGDFTWMINRPEHAGTLFIFNDNEEEFYAHLRGGVQLGRRDETRRAHLQHLPGSA